MKVSNPCMNFLSFDIILENINLVGLVGKIVEHI
jgi:hypothetical protein